MDWFSLFLDGLTLAGLGALHITLTGRLCEKRAGPRLFALYLLALCAVEAACRALSLGTLFAVASELLVLYAVNRLALGGAPAVSGAAAVLAVYIPQLSFGIVNSLESLLFLPAVGSPLLYPLVILFSLLALGLSAVICALVLRLFPPPEERMPRVWAPLLTAAFFLSAEFYLLQTAYSRAAPLPPEPGKHLALLALQLLGLLAMLCTLYAYRRVCQGLRAQAALDALSQAARAQRTYIRDARAREERTRSLRHDWNHHLTVLEGLLRAGETAKAAGYLSSLRTAAEALSPAFRTGSAVIDILLADKLADARARGVEAEVSLLWPRESGVDDFDLCVIFANALDNAVRACLETPAPGSLRITGCRQGDFYRLSFENACAPGPLPPMGTGLRNIRAAAEKYRGAVLAEKEGGCFRLHVLLNISEPPGGSSEQTP